MDGKNIRVTTQPPVDTTVDRENGFDTLRLISALAVLLGHACVIGGRAVPEIGGVPVHTLGLFNLFVISGYLTTLSWSRAPSLVNYMAKRSLRIFPGLVVTVLFIAFVIGPLFTTRSLGSYLFDRHTLLFVVRNAALWFDDWLPGLFERAPLQGGADGALWTLPIEYGLYLTVPLIAYVARYRPALAAAVIAVGASGLIWLSMISSWQSHLKIYRVDVDAALEIIPFFFAGAALALIPERRFLPLGSGSVSALMVAVALIGLVPQNWNYLFMLAALSVLIVGCGSSRFLYLSGLRRVGDLSYGVYLIHWPVASVMVDIFGVGVPFPLLISVTVILSLLYAWLLWHFVERPGLSLKRRLKRHAAALQTGYG